MRVAVEGVPPVGGRPFVPGPRVDGVRRRAHGQDVEDHGLVVAAPIMAEKACFRLPPHADQGPAAPGAGPGPIDAAIQRPGVSSDFAFRLRVAGEVRLGRKHAGHQQGRIDGGELRAPQPEAGLLVQEVVEKPLVPRDAGRSASLRGFPEKLQCRPCPLGGLSPGDVAALRPDDVGGEGEPHARDARVAVGREAVRGEPVARIGRFPEEGERVALECVQKGFLSRGNLPRQQLQFGR